MKQMMTIAGGILFAIASISLIVGGVSVFQIVQFQNELESRGQVNKALSELTGIEKLNEQELKRKQDAMIASFAIAGIFGFVGIGLAFAGKSKTTQ
jgi:hypothetical protein